MNSFLPFGIDIGCTVYNLFFFAGCKNCANMAPDVFAIEEDFGRARVYSQCGKPDLVQQAIDSW